MVEHFYKAPCVCFESLKDYDIQLPFVQFTGYGPAKIMTSPISFRLVEIQDPETGQKYPRGIAFDFRVTRREHRRSSWTPVDVEYYLPSSLHVIVANIESDQGFKRTLVGAADLQFSPSHLNHLEKWDSKHATFDEFRAYIDRLHPVAIDGLSNLYFIMDLRTSPYAGEIYKPNTKPAILSAIPGIKNGTQLFQEARKIEAMVPLLIKDKNDETNWFYGSMKVTYEKTPNFLWKIALVEPYDLVIPRDDEGSWRGQLQLLEIRVRRTNEALPKTRLRVEDLGKLQIALTNVVDEMDPSDIWHIVKVKDVLWTHQEDVERRKMLFAEVKAQGQDPVEFVRFLGNKSW